MPKSNETYAHFLNAHIELTWWTCRCIHSLSQSTINSRMIYVNFAWIKKIMTIRNGNARLPELSECEWGVRGQKFIIKFRLYVRHLPPRSTEKYVRCFFFRSFIFCMFCNVRDAVSAMSAHNFLLSIHFTRIIQAFRTVLMCVHMHKRLTCT